MDSGLFKIYCVRLKIAVSFSLLAPGDKHTGSKGIALVGKLGAEEEAVEVGHFTVEPVKVKRRQTVTLQVEACATMADSGVYLLFEWERNQGPQDFVDLRRKKREESGEVNRQRRWNRSRFASRLVDSRHWLLH